MGTFVKFGLKKSLEEMKFVNIYEICLLALKSAGLNPLMQN
jgi:hypothetical protein